MKKILIIEDNEMNRDMLSRRLKKAGYEIVMAVNGLEGIEMTKSENPALILMDIRMPIMDGLEATNKLKTDLKTQAIPIIILTAYSLPIDKEKILKSKCDDFEIKPINFERLLKKIRYLLEKSG